MSIDGCPFCSLPKERIWLESDAGIAFRDGYPVAEGHSLIIPRRHVASVFDLDDKEYADLWRMVSQVRDELAKEFKPDGFNVGINEGEAAGQTVAHAHIHVIPRRTGDVEDPRGGVRWVVPEKADYWTKR
jgi:diadenosine tetraphosphate (Ap4A) HIT family hydrolase